MAKGIFEKIVFRIREGYEDYDLAQANEYFSSIQEDAKKKDKNAKFYKKELKDRVEFLILEKADEITIATNKNFLENA